MFEILQDISAYISVPLLLFYGLVVFQIWKRIEQLKNEQIGIQKMISSLKEGEIKVLERHIDFLKDERSDPNKLLAQVEIIEKASKKEIEELRRKLEKEKTKDSGDKNHSINLIHEIPKVESLLNADNLLSRRIMHELITPVLSIRATSNMLSRKLEKDDTESYLTANRYIHQIEELSEGIINLVQGIETVFISENYSVVKESINFVDDLIRPLIDKIERSAMADGRKLIISVNSDWNIPIIDINKPMIELAIYNVVWNSVVYANSLSGKETAIDLVCFIKNESLILSISDNGIGINDIDKMNIFKLGYRSESAIRTSVRGTGMGLYVAKKAMELHNGDLELKSTRNPTQFLFSFPINK